MTDFEYDAYLKKNVAHSAMRRKGGSKSKKCNLSTDHMSNKQWKERCGTVMSYQLGKPMTWHEFCKLPKDLKEEYLNGLIQKYSANARGMAEMFGVSVASVFRIVKKENLDVQFVKGRHPAGEKEDAFKRFLNGEIEPQCVTADAPTANEQDGLEAYGESSVVLFESPEAPQPEVKHEQRTRLDSFTMSFSGEINVDMIANSLRYILGSGGNATIKIICELC